MNKINGQYYKIDAENLVNQMNSEIINKLLRLININFSN